MYVKATGNTIQQFPYPLGTLKADNPQISFPESFPPALLAQFNVYPVTQIAAPSFDPNTEELQRNNNPILNGSTWELGWTVIPLNADSKYIKQRGAALPNGYDHLDLEALEILRDEVQIFDNNALAPTPGCALVAGILGATETQIRNAARTKGNTYRQAVLTAWANRRLSKGGV